jgi:hypothetical protein
LGGNTVERLPMFDIEVSAVKANPYSKLSQNELALQFYSAGFFAPQNADMTLATLNMMDFDHKEDVIKQVQQNGTMYQMLMQMQMENEKLRMLADMAYGSNLTGGQQPIPQAQAGGAAPTPEDTQRAFGKTSNSLNEGDGSNSKSEQLRKRAANSTEV